MGTSSAGSSSRRPNGLKAIFWGGLLAGTLDITGACVNLRLRGRTPIWVLQSVATGWFGRASYAGRYKTAAIGLASHYVIAFVATILFYAASRKARVLVDQALVCGLLYGVVVFAVMNSLVVPLSAISQAFPYTRAQLITNCLIIVFCVGLPIALVVRRYSSR